MTALAEDDLSPAGIEKNAAFNRQLRDHTLATDPRYAALDGIAKELAAIVRASIDPDAAIEWGRAMQVAAGLCSSVAVLIQRDTGTTPDPLFLNLLGWVGLDLMDGGQ